MAGASSLDIGPLAFLRAVGVLLGICIALAMIWLASKR